MTAPFSNADIGCAVRVRLLAVDPDPEVPPRYPPPDEAFVERWALGTIVAVAPEHRRVSVRLAAGHGGWIPDDIGIERMEEAPAPNGSRERPYEGALPQWWRFAGGR